MARKNYFIVNPAGIIHECDKEHARWRLKSPGWRVPTGAELKAYKAAAKKAKAGYEQDIDGKKIAGSRFIQRPSDPIAEPWDADPDKAMEAAEAAMAEAEASDGEDAPEDGQDAPDAPEESQEGPEEVDEVEEAEEPEE